MELRTLANFSNVCWWSLAHLLETSQASQDFTAFCQRFEKKKYKKIIAYGKIGKM